MREGKVLRELYNPMFGNFFAEKPIMDTWQLSMSPIGEDQEHRHSASHSQMVDVKNLAKCE